jgi:Flp pilus assembly protein TadG
MNPAIARSRRRNRRTGQAAAEFALVVPVFLLVLFAIMEMSLVVYHYYTMCEAAREAVRYAIVHSPTGPNPATASQIQQIAINYAPALNLSPGDISVSSPADANLATSKDARVAISHAYKLRIPFLQPVTLTLASSAQMLVSQ